jgi:serine/threonine protein kinase/formylglycine-generating enzyme required for sulfatase activity
MSTTAPSTCDVCGTALPGQMPKGLCPRCLIKSGLFSSKGQSSTVILTQQGDPLRTGHRVGGNRFSLVDQLGEGGMGVVWLAMDEELSKEGVPFFVALKFLAPHIRTDPRALALLREEVLQSRKLRHPRIVSLYDWHALPNEPTFISMEYVEGVNLSQFLSLQPEQFLRWRDLARWVHQLCDALDYAHTEERIIHRDLKPANLMLNQKSDLKLADFGLARAYVTTLTSPVEQTQVRGTPLYMSPQQMAGKSAHPTDDIYSLGATLYELLTGTPPFYTGGDIFQQVMQSPAEPIAHRLATLGYQNQIPFQVQMAIGACLQKETAKRPQTVRELAQLLGVEKHVLQPVAEAPVVEETVEEPPPRQSHPFALTLLALVMLLVATTHLWPGSAPVQKFNAKVDGIVESVIGLPPPPPASPPTPKSQLSVESEPFGTLVELRRGAGRALRSARAEPTNVIHFTNLMAGPYVVSASRVGYLATNLEVQLKSGTSNHLTLKLSQDPGAPPPPPGPELTNVLVLRCADSRPVHFRLFDASRRTNLVEGTFVSEKRLDWLALGDHFLEAGLTNIERTASRVNLPVKLQPGTNELALDFKWKEMKEARVRVHVNLEVTNLMVMDHWGNASSIQVNLHPSREYYYGWHTNTSPGEWTYRCTFPPHFADLETNIFIPPLSGPTIELTLLEAKAPYPGHHWTNSLDMAMVWVGPDANKGIPNGFWACATETAWKHYQEFAAQTGQVPQDMVSVTAQGWTTNRHHTWQNPGFPQKDKEDHPVVGVSWHDATNFCARLTEKEQGRLRGRRYLLPSHAPWSGCAWRYALPTDEQWSFLAGESTYPWGDHWPPGRSDANCAGSEINETTASWFPFWPVLTNHWDEWPQTAPVATCKPNGRGLYHLGGNVSEWCDTDYRPELNAPDLRQRYELLGRSLDGEVYKVLRGGSWYDHHPDELMTATHLRAKPDERHDRYGFRVILIQEERSGKEPALTP